VAKLAREGASAGINLGDDKLGSQNFRKVEPTISPHAGGDRLDPDRPVKFEELKLDVPQPTRVATDIVIRFCNDRQGENKARDERVTQAVGQTSSGINAEHRSARLPEKRADCHVPLRIKSVGAT